MGFKFRKSIKLAPGIKVNLSKSGVSTSLGGRGASVNIGHGRIKGTVGVPGTGLSYSAQTKKLKSSVDQVPSGLTDGSGEATKPQTIAGNVPAARPTTSSLIFRYDTPEGLKVVVDARSMTTRVDVTTPETTHRLKYLGIVEHSDGLIITTSEGRGVRINPDQAAEVSALVARTKSVQAAGRVSRIFLACLAALVVLFLIGRAISGG